MIKQLIVIFGVFFFVLSLQTKADDKKFDLNPDAVDVTGVTDDENRDIERDSGPEKRTWGYYGGWFRTKFRRNRRYRTTRYGRINYRTYYRPHYRPYYRSYYRRYWYNGYRKYYRYQKPTFRPTTTPKPPTTATPKPKCSHGHTVLDKCQRSCTCRAGKLVDCYRVRKEFTHIPKEKRLRYLKAVRAISSQAPYKTRYEELLDIHRQYFRTPIHEATNFLPWHRWFVLQYENLLREVDCSLTVPYWDWALVAADPFKSDFWNQTYGFGGNGIGFPPCVRTGPFNYTNWTVPGGGCLQRNFIDIPGVIPNIAAVAKVLAKKLADFFDFELMLRVNLHDVVHFAIGAVSITESSAIAPEFFPIHGFVDKLWDEWQSKGNLYRYQESYLAQNYSMPGTNVTATEMLSNKNLPECVKVKYAEPRIGEWEELIKNLKKMAETNPSELHNLPRMRMAKISEKTFEAFQVRKRERERARSLELELETKYEVDVSLLKGMEKMIGIRAADVKEMMKKVYSINKLI